MSFLMAAVIVAGCRGGEARQGLAVGEPASARAGAAAELAVVRTIFGNPPRRELVVFDGGPGRPRVLAAGAVGYSRPAWSPDGERLAVVRVSGGGFADGRTDVFVVGRAGGPAHRLTETGRALTPVWSPDGRTIVFAEREPGPPFPPTARLWAMDADGGGRRPLTEPEHSRTDLPSSFSPDGSRLAFTRCVWRELTADARLENGCSVDVLDVRTLDVRRLADRAADPAFAPDGSKIAFVSDRDENGELSYGDRVFYANELYVMDSGGGAVQRLTRTRDLNERAPSWSPDGTLLAYQRGEVTGNAEASSVFTVRADGSCPRPFAADPGLAVSYGVPAWRPAAASAPAECGPREVGAAAVPLAGNLSLAEVRRFRDFGLYWVGRRFERFVLSSASVRTASAPGGRGRVVELHYGGFNVQLWPACARVPGHVSEEVSRRPARIRGVPGVFFEDGHRLELVTGRTTIVLHGEHRRIVRVAGALRPLNRSAALGRGGRLPAPAPGALAGKLRCSAP